jgi:hypothetical protein
LVAAGELFKAGKDSLGIEAFFANDRDLVANQAKVTALKTVYRHGNKPVGTQANKDKQAGRLYASPVANSDDGLGGALTSTDQSWHPFYNKIYQDGVLAEIKMSEAEIGFAIASHYLWMAEGARKITVAFTVTAELPDRKNDVVCFLTSEKGWIEKPASKFITEAGVLKLEIELSGADPAVTAYIAKTHGYDLPTSLPVLLVKLQHREAAEYIYSELQDGVITKIDIKVDVVGLKTLAVSNDFGPVDTSKPFQPYGASPVAGNSLIVGAKEIFQKNITSTSLEIRWLVTPASYPATAAVNVNIDYLKAGQWMTDVEDPKLVATTKYLFGQFTHVVDGPDFTPNEFYNTVSQIILKSVEF